MFERTTWRTFRAIWMASGFTSGSTELSGIEGMFGRM